MKREVVGVCLSMISNKLLNKNNSPSIINNLSSKKEHLNNINSQNNLYSFQKIQNDER